MPTPIEILMDPLSIGLISVYVLLIIAEAIFPARRLVAVNGWRLKTLVTFVIYFYLSTYLPLLWDEYLFPYQLADLSALSTIAGALVGLLVFQFFLYVWHRAMHGNSGLWRVFHQMHHSAERVDTFGAFFFSPMDMIGFTFLGSLSLVLIVGVSPQAVTLYLYASMFLVVFQHANIKTPRWLGYIIQRPESHSVHHEKGMHAYNYADLPLFDILFGTFKNPAEFSKEAGFYHGASSRVAEMLLAKDVSNVGTRVIHSGSRRGDYS